MIRMDPAEDSMSPDRSPRIHVGILGAAKVRFRLNGRYRIPGRIESLSGICEASLRNGCIEARVGEQRITSCDQPTSNDQPPSSDPEGSRGPAFSSDPVTSRRGASSRLPSASPGEIRFDPEEIRTAYFELSDVVIGIGFHWEQKENQKFRGTLVLKISDHRIQVINEIPLERYLASVISSEMSADSSPELLKAHAIMSRSWLLAQIGKRDRAEGPGSRPEGMRETEDELIRWYDREDHEDFDVCADDHCQRYQGITRAHNPEVVRAVNGTAGEVLFYGNTICDARFSKCCGGVTERFESCWEELPHPYLQSVPDSQETGAGQQPSLKDEANAEKHIRSRPEAFCNTTDVKLLRRVLNDYDLDSKDFFRWKVTYHQDELSALIREKSGRDFGKIINLVPVERGPSGRLISLRIEGSKKTMTIGKELEIRRWLSRTHLYSSAFTVDREDLRKQVPGTFILHGAGWGHGVGLCQIGAAVMAGRGYSYREILTHYFRNADIRKQYG